MHIQCEVKNNLEIQTKSKLFDTVIWILSEKRLLLPKFSDNILRP